MIMVLETTNNANRTESQTDVHVWMFPIPVHVLRNFTPAGILNRGVRKSNKKNANSEGEDNNIT